MPVSPRSDRPCAGIAGNPHCILDAISVMNPMTSTPRTASPREISLVNLNQLIDKLESLSTFTEDSTPTVLASTVLAFNALTKQIKHAGKEHLELFQWSDTNSGDRAAFQAMFDRFTAAIAAGQAAAAGVVTQQVTAGAKAGQVTAGAGSTPSSSSASAGAAVTAAAAPSSLPVVTAGAIAELQSNQAAIVASLADLTSSIAELQKNQAEAARKQEALTSSFADLQRNQKALTSSIDSVASSVASVLSAMQDVQHDNRNLRDELSAMRSQVKGLPERQDAFAMDILKQQQLLRRELDQMQRQGDTPAPAPAPVPTDLLLDFGPLLLDSSAVKLPCQKTIDLLAAFPSPKLVPPTSDPDVHLPAVPTPAPLPVPEPSLPAPSDLGPVSSETPEPSPPAPPTPPWPPPSPSAASPTSVAQLPTPSPALAAVICDGPWGSDSSDDDALHCGSDAIVQPPFPSPACPSRPIDDG